MDTTGAGDFYAAGYIFGQLITSNLDVSLELGSMLVANAIKQIGASPTDDVANEILKNILNLLGNNFYFDNAECFT